MIKEEILAMKAGRDLDGLVAKEVMGIEVGYPFGEGFPYYLVEDGIGQRSWDAVTLYSTDISAAWQVVEKLSARYEIIIRLGPPVGDVCKVLCGVCDLQDRLIVEAYGNSAPEAICKAALLAKLKNG